MIGTLLLLAVAALLVPTLAARLATPAAAHEAALSDASAILLVIVETEFTTEAGELLVVNRQTLIWR